MGHYTVDVCIPGSAPWGLLHAGQELYPFGTILSKPFLKSDLNVSRTQQVVSKLRYVWVNAKYVRRLLFDR